ncbi:uncharacterized protein TNCV_3682481 [Trichonephila clavipes]|uniref:Uncharacterized protein n=1 Tax=Trichonephila clavipes TaxID=2585209 RepID=A0A8X6RLW4_TRICX|nr:uncharacterized protein TNCV_3682481 [Trichonephila clavipes]
MRFAIPMIWRETKDHFSDCYFCLTNTKGIMSKSKHTVLYPNLQSAMRPVPHSEELPIPKPPEHVTLDEERSDYDRSKEEETVCGDTTFEPSCSSEPHLLTQEDLNDFIQDLKISKKQSEMLGSWLKGWNLLQKNTKICTYRSRHSQYKDYFSEKVA